MTARTKIDVHARTLLMEFSDKLVQFNIFEAMKHPTEDPTLFGIDIIDELVVEHMQLEATDDEFLNLAKNVDVIDCLGSVTDESNYDKLLEVQDLSDFKDDIDNLVDLDINSETVDWIDQVCKYDEESKCLEGVRVQVAETEKPHKKAIGWHLLDLPGINPSIYTHKILMKEEAHPIRQQQGRMNPTIYPISDS
ncbi:hypothetical protein CR513_11290, partial [Mucuna pruriens]